MSSSAMVHRIGAERKSSTRCSNSSATSEPSAGAPFTARHYVWCSLIPAKRAHGLVAHPAVSLELQPEERAIG